MLRSASSHLFRNDRRKAKPTEPKITAFWAQVITVRGLITVEMSPPMKPERVMSATRTMLATVLRPASVSNWLTLATTMAVSVWCGR